MNIYDIAACSGVSIATVSRVLNNSPSVSPKTREKVLRVMQQESYTPNAFARGLGLNSMHMIGLLCTDVSDTYYAKAVSLVEKRLRKDSYDALLCCTGNDPTDQKKFLQLLLSKHVDAVILIGSAFKEDAQNAYLAQAAKEVPVVIINGLVELPGVYCVLCDERNAVRQNVHSLLHQGITRILYLYDVLTYSGCQKRVGYQDGLAEAGLPEMPELTVQVPKSIPEVRDAVAALLKDGPSFSAILASEDLIAIGALKALQNAGLQMPVIGFNNSILAQCASPGLTSVDNMLEILCPTAVGLLEKLLSGEPVPQKTVISSRLVERETFHAN
ncbi:MULTISPECIES: LacI family DNA-binding transcriptional regulator [Caproicibacterium]|uniref:LacI family DNA-binding transcriptional regulator n=1 Tax=Caproicibacterium argilliputei TaxID=3030016 RepID=A0AA97H1W2_9FIRM|nr:LacI family DNA-binding transcriptional regulator [Caproicibacterium argilliputei]WOC32833.1 LacI family DNA-binding transcriptional regulator [Caproicibacterium argilliputei]